jgi:hypothetical protein
MNYVRESVATYAIEEKTSYEPGASQEREDILSVLRRFRPSKQSSATRTAPVINSLNQVWVVTVARSPLVNINLVHRNLYFDITSSDPVEDYLDLNPAEEASRVVRTTVPGMPEEVLLFCEKEGVSRYLPDAVRIIRQSFEQIESLKTEVEEDPETGEKWMLISITAHGEVEEILEQYDRYTESWVSAAPWPECHKIRLSFDIV